jgi:hypothetical protein
MGDARQRLARALVPQSTQEHAIVEWLGKWDLPTLETLVLLVERRIRTTRRAARMDLADQVIEYFIPAPGSPANIEARFEHIASGGDDNGDDLAHIVGQAYDKGWAEAVEHCRSQQPRGVDPELRQKKWP